MSVIHRLLAGSAAVLAAQSLGAQQPSACPGPGGAFGVTAYQCSSCEFQHEKSLAPAYSFHAEPIVLRTSATSALRPGDIVEAVNGQPITTRAGMPRI